MDYLIRTELSNLRSAGLDDLELQEVLDTVAIGLMDNVAGSQIDRFNIAQRELLSQ